MTAALDYYYNQDDFFDTELLPADPVGQDFIRLFNPHYWDFVYARVSRFKQQVNWYLEKQYPLEPRILWRMYKNPKELVGLSFKEQTNYFVLDIDWYSQYHPRTDKYMFKELLGRLEDIGLCRPIIIQSSSSGGLHVYFFLPYPIHSYTLAAAIAEHLYWGGFNLDGGQLELYPHPKRWSKEPSSFRPIRLPLQAGSWVLDGDFQAIHNDVQLFLEEAELTSTLQDMDALSEALGLAPEWSARQFSSGEGKMTAVHFRNHLEAIMAEGWTGFGQTNNILKKIATYGVIFQDLSGQDLADYIARKAQSLPGYYIFCRHRHEIHQRAKHVGKWAESYPYNPYPDSPIRDITYKQHDEIFFGRGHNSTNANGSKVVSFTKVKQRHERTVEKLSTVITLLQEAGTYPEATTARGNAIIAKSKEVYGEGISPNTLRKNQYRKYWHPLYIEIEQQQEASIGQVSVIACCERDTEFILPDPWDELEESQSLEPVLGHYLSDWERYWQEREVKSRQSKDLQELHQNSIYEGQRLLAPSLSASEEIAIYNSQELIQIETDSKFNLFLTVLILVILINSRVNSQCKYKLNLFIFKHLEFLRVKSRYVLPSQFNDRSDASGSATSNQQPSSSNHNPATDAQQAHEQGQTASDGHKDTPSDSSSLQGQIKGNSANSTNNLPKLVGAEIPKPASTTTANNQQQPTAFSQALEESENTDGDLIAPLPPLQWQEARFKFSTLQEAKRKLNTFCISQGVRLLPQMRDQLRQFLQHCLMDKSEYPTLQQQAWEWFASNQELIAQIKDLTEFWDHFGDLVY